MDNLIRNKNQIMFCIVLILGAVVVLLYLNNNDIIDPDNDKENRIKSYEANKYIPVYVTDADMANKYLNDYKNIIMSDINEAYNLLNSNYREKKYGTIDNFRNHIDDISNIAFYSMKVKEYSVFNNNGYKFYYVETSSDDIYIFKEISIMNYEVFLDKYTVELK